MIHASLHAAGGPLMKSSARRSCTTAIRARGADGARRGPCAELPGGDHVLRRPRLRFDGDAHSDDDEWRARCPQHGVPISQSNTTPHRKQAGFYIIRAPLSLGRASTKYSVRDQVGNARPDLGYFRPISTAFEHCVSNFDQVWACFGQLWACFDQAPLGRPAC